MKKAKDHVPFRTKVCTVISAILVIAALGFSVYCQMPDCQIPDSDNPLWGGAFLVLLAIALWILLNGWKAVDDD